MSDKQKFDRAAAIRIAKQIYDELEPVTDRIVFAGSLRRRKKQVGDIEVLYIPILVEEHKDLFSSEMVSLVDKALADMEKRGVLERRLNTKGSEMYGEKNKLMRHKASGIPMDFFAATRENWHNYLVCRTGPAELNTRIASLAQARGWKWNPYGAGFSRGGPLAGEKETYEVHSEREVFEFVGLKYMEPWERAL